MKRLLFLALFVVAMNSAFSQTYQGQWMVGGNASFESYKHGDVDDSKLTTFQLNPNVGYFFINNLAGGVRLSFTSFKEEDDEDAFTVLSAGPFIRYYFLPPAEKVNIFADAGASFGSIGGDDKESFNEFSIMAGPSIFLTPNVGLEFGLFYKSQGGDAVEMSWGDDDRDNTFGINIGFQIHLGNRMARTTTNN